MAALLTRVLSSIKLRLRMAVDLFSLHALRALFFKQQYTPPVKDSDRCHYDSQKLLRRLFLDANGKRIAKQILRTCCRAAKNWIVKALAFRGLTLSRLFSHDKARLRSHFRHYTSSALKCAYSAWKPNDITKLSVSYQIKGHPRH